MRRNVFRFLNCAELTRDSIAAIGRGSNREKTYTQKQTPRIASRRLRWPAFRLPTRLAVGFGLEALPASGWIHPGRWQAVASVPPLLRRRRIRLASRGGSLRQTYARTEPLECGGLPPP